MTAREATTTQKSIRFRGRSFVAFVLSPELPIADWLEGLDKWTENSPRFFVGRPVVLDVANLALSTSEIEDLIGQLSKRGIRIMGLDGASEAQLAPSLPPLLAGGRPTHEEPTVEVVSAQPPARAPAPQEPRALVVEAPIRSGQSVIFPYGDVTVLGSVASGAEVVAGGSVHVYGTLRGRVMAGSSGNAHARIFCRHNEAELLAIDGYYRTAEDMDATVRGRATQMWLEGGVPTIALLD